MTIDELMKSWGNFLLLYTNNDVFKHNMELLSKQTLEMLGQKIQYDTITNTVDLYRRGLMEGEIWQPEILDTDETLRKIENEPKSFCRFGDGEIQIMKGNSTPFQEFHPELARKMLAILQSDSQACYVAIQKGWYTWSTTMNEHQSYWNIVNRKLFTDFVDAYANRKRCYLNTGFTLTYMEEGDRTPDFWKEHFEKKLNLFSGKKLVVFAGSNILDGLDNNIFARSKSIEMIGCPKKNAFSAYDHIMEKARSYPKEGTILIFILGQTATVITWELAHEGYMAWDIGHMAKDYDAYCKKKGKSAQEAVQFFLPD